ncbi:MAG: phosphatase PAP2 family protein [Planctomycetaceae bacterium]|jgi:membrane-associated phospholipid phosphatase|nr:phosphatase PAP2 family protein [Planctomycetaceae bacterium]
MNRNIYWRYFTLSGFKSPEAERDKHNIAERLVQGRNLPPVPAKVLQFVAIVICGLLLIFVCNRFFDYPVASWFCEKGFNIIERPKPQEVDGVVTGVDGVVAGVGGEGKSVSGGGILQRQLSRWILLLEFFGHPLCFLMVLSVCFLLDVDKRERLWRFVFSVLASQAVVAAIKFSIYRKRPVINDFNLSSFDLSGFIGRDDIHSFPSGHTALVFAIAFVMARSYPRGRYLFFLAAMGVMFERVFDCRHYLSDTVAGGLIAYVVYFLCYELSFVAKIFNYFGLTTVSNSSIEKQNKPIDNKKPIVIFGKGSSSNKHLGSGIHQFLRANDKLIDLNSQQHSNSNTTEPTQTKDQTNPTPDQIVPAQTPTQKKSKPNNRKNNLPFDQFRFF